MIHGNASYKFFFPVLFVHQTKLMYLLSQGGMVPKKGYSITIYHIRLGLVSTIFQKTHSSVRYTSFDKALAMDNHAVLGPDDLVEPVNLTNAFRCLPVYYSDNSLLGFTILC